MAGDFGIQRTGNRFEIVMAEAGVPVGRADGGQANLIQPSNRPGRVRVGPGETLETLARRFYGDPAMASRLWEANRDQLRNPALLVAGMELRLP